MDRPWVYLIGVSALLLALAAPFLSVRWGSSDEQLLPPEATSRVAQQTYARHFGGDQTWAYAMIEGATPELTADYLRRVAAVPGISRPTVQRVNPSTGVVFATIGWPGTAQSLSLIHISEPTRPY